MCFRLGTVSVPGTLNEFSCAAAQWAINTATSATRVHPHFASVFSH